MYREYFSLIESPFSIAPDPRYLYMSDQHREALAHLLYGIQGEGGFVLLTGEVGTGKTTVCRCLLEQIPETCSIAYILNPRLTVEELLSTICDEFRIPYPANNTSIKVFIDLINRYLLESHARGRSSVLIIDEAQNLSLDVLEQMRLLTNLETDKRKLLQIIMIGQPELRALVARPELRQLAQRIIARYHLGPLCREEVVRYVYHRLKVAGCRGPLFSEASLSLVFRLSGGIPRVINVLCDRALLGAYVQERRTVDRRTIANAAREVLSRSDTHGSRRGSVIGWMLLGGALVLGSGVLLAESPWVHSLFDPVHWAAPKVLPQAQVAAPPEPGEETLLATPHRKPIPNSEPAELAPAPVQGSPASPPADASPPQSPAVPRLQWTGTSPHAQSESMAYQTLFERWGARYEASGSISPCHQAELQGLSCLSGRGGLDELRRLNVPAVLSLIDEGLEFHGALVNLSDKTATFIVGQEIQTIPFEELASHWQGDYTVLWRTPPAYRGPIQAGNQGPLVGWAKTRLALLRGESAPAVENPHFDRLLDGEVRKFQLAQGLNPDGILGPHTLIRLMIETDQGVPLLIPRKKDG